MPRKNPFVAGGLSLVLPGAGQVYNRQIRKALIGYAFFFLFPIVFVLCNCLHSFWGLVLLIFLCIWLYLYNVGDAILGAVRFKTNESRPLNKFLIMMLVIFIAADVIIIAGYPSKNIIGLRALRLITDSMAPTLQAGDSFILDLNYYKNNKIQRGDLIVFERALYKGPLCKRVIGLPSDKIEGTGDEVLVNGEAIHESYTQHIGRNARLDDFNQKHQLSDFGSITVPDGQLFVMGDNRDNSYDSRDPDFGFVPVQSVWAKPLYIYFSTSRSRIGKTIK